MTEQQALYALENAARPVSRQIAFKAMFEREAHDARSALRAQGIYGKRTLHTKLRQVDSWRSNLVGDALVAYLPYPRATRPRLRTHERAFRKALLSRIHL